MAKPISVPNTFAGSTSAIPLVYLDQDFSTISNATNDLATYSNYVADTGVADAYIANYPANIVTTTVTAGLRLQFKAANANTGASTLQVQVNSVSIGSGAIKLTDGEYGKPPTRTAPVLAPLLDNTIEHSIVKTLPTRVNLPERDV